MTTPTRPQSARRRLAEHHGMRGLTTLLGSEARLFTRDVGNVFFVVGFPTVLLLGMAFAIPGMRETITDAPQPFTGLRPMDLFAPIVVAVAVATAGLTTLPTYLAAYRETGVLRRLATTPMRPLGVLVGQVLAQLAGLTVGCGLALGVGAMVIGLPGPERIGLAAASYLLAVAAIFAIGLMLGGLAPKATTASGIGMLLYFPMLFLAGMWTPGPLMPDTLERIAAYSPLGAASQSLSAAWFGGDLPILQLLVMAGWAVAAFGVALRTFRWD
ncbi:ABC transporter permease [Ornithinimicrobium cryptoxanthini]|uniref:Transport permease protein n=1 Tax=Ornithinimicrobium cryptoxanthini TaxID=2934161 RepID=A0ABY4YDM6_9MICO|nr:ABC transporter permease [Ornithinimicrobium cryptoxanthini]USQ74878.1 ABC transporter permease [Ornithinimicrobium cryptoxanthini]